MCCEMTKLLKMIAETLINKDHNEIARQMDSDDEEEFYNAVRTLQTHADYIATKRAA